MTIGQAVHRVCGEIAEWFQIDAGVLDIGKRADLVIIDPTKLDERIEEAHEEPMEGFGGLRRLVRRNDETIDAVFVNGKLAVKYGKPTAELGNQSGFGQVLRAGTWNA